MSRNQPFLVTLVCGLAQFRHHFSETCVQSWARLVCPCWNTPELPTSSSLFLPFQESPALYCLSWSKVYLLPTTAPSCADTSLLCLSDTVAYFLCYCCSFITPTHDILFSEMWVMTPFVSFEIAFSGSRPEFLKMKQNSREQLGTHIAHASWMTQSKHSSWFMVQRLESRCHLFIEQKTLTHLV